MLDKHTGLKQFSFHTSGMGIGDAVSAYYVACGLATATGGLVDYYCRHNLDWFSAVAHPGVTILPHREIGPDANQDYLGQLAAAAAKLCPSRSQWLCDNLSREFQISPFQPVRPAVIREQHPIAGKEYIVFSPFSLNSSREWPTGKWRELANSYLREGRRVIALDGPGDGSRLTSMFSNSSVECYWGLEPAWVVAILANADLFIGNDSGMSHIAGLLGTQAKVLMTHLSPEFVFAEAPSVTGVLAKGWNCQGCGWQAAFGFQSNCHAQCQALASIDAERVRSTNPPPRTATQLFELLRKNLGRREESLCWLLDQVQTRFEHPAIVETGCIRSREDWGAGAFTWVMGSWLDILNRGALVSIDNNFRNCAIARELCSSLSRVTIKHSDSVTALLGRKDRVDVAYLDSLDANLPYHAEFGLAEAEAVEPLMTANGIIAFDDTPPHPDGGWSGKGRLGVPWLLSRGWRVAPESGYVTILNRG